MLLNNEKRLSGAAADGVNQAQQANFLAGALASRESRN